MRSQRPFCFDQLLGHAKSSGLDGKNILEIIVVGDVYHKSITEQSSFLYSPTRLDQTFVSSSRFESGLSLNLMVLAVGEGSGLEDKRALSAGDE